MSLGGADADGTEGGPGRAPPAGAGRQRVQRSPPGQEHRRLGLPGEGEGAGDRAAPPGRSAQGGLDLVEVLGAVAGAQRVEGTGGVRGPQALRIERGDPAVGLLGQPERELRHLARR